MHNLISVNDVTESVEFDCTVRLLWQDSRWELNDLMDQLSSSQYEYGVAIDAMIDNDLRIWRPIIQFVDQISLTVVDEVTRIRANGTIYMTQHIVLKLAQQQLDFHKYPLDTQTLEIKFDVLAMPSSVLVIEFMNPAVVFSVEQGGSNSWANNALWSYDYYTTVTKVENLGTATNVQNFSFGVVSVTQTRIGSGIILRLGIPMACISILVGVLFWSDRDQRLGLTIYLLLTMSTLYISVSQNVPQVGYTTYIGLFGLWLFGLIFCCCILHQFTYRLMADGKKARRYPLRLCYVRAMEFAGKLFVLPLVLSLFLVFFGAIYSESVGIIVAVIVLFVPTILLRESPGLIKEFKYDMKQIYFKSVSFAKNNGTVSGKSTANNAQTQSQAEADNAEEDAVLHADNVAEFNKLFVLERLVFNKYHFNSFTSEDLIPSHTSWIVTGTGTGIWPDSKSVSAGGGAGDQSDDLPTMELNVMHEHKSY